MHPSQLYAHKKCNVPLFIQHHLCHVSLTYRIQDQTTLNFDNVNATRPQSTVAMCTRVRDRTYKTCRRTEQLMPGAKRACRARRLCGGRWRWREGKPTKTASGAVVMQSRNLQLITQDCKETQSNTQVRVQRFDLGLECAAGNAPGPAR